MVLKTSKAVMQNQTPTLIHIDTISLTSIIMIVEVLNKHHCKLYEILINFCLDQSLRFSVIFEFYATVVAEQNTQTQNTQSPKIPNAK